MNWAIVVPSTKQADLMAFFAPWQDYFYGINGIETSHKKSPTAIVGPHKWFF